MPRMAAVPVSLLKELAAYVEEQMSYVEESAHYHGDDDDFVENARAPEEALLAQIDDALRLATVDAAGSLIPHAMLDSTTGQMYYVYLRLEYGGIGLYVHDNEQEDERTITHQARAIAQLEAHDNKVSLLGWHGGEQTIAHVLIEN